MYVSRVFFTSVIKRVFVSLPLAIYIKFLTYSHFTHFFFFFCVLKIHERRDISHYHLHEEEEEEEEEEERPQRALLG